MKIRVWLDSGANIHSCREEIIDLENDWNISPDEWKEMSERDRDKMIDEWMWNHLDVGWSYVHMGDQK